MSVLFLDPVATLGGAERSLLDLLASLRAAAPSIRIGLVTGSDGPLARDAAALGARVEVLPLPGHLSQTGEHSIDGLLEMIQNAPSLVMAAAELGVYGIKLRRVISSFGPSVVHSNGVKMHVLSALVGQAGVPLVWHLRDFVGQRAITAPALRVLAERVSSVVAISHSVADDARRALGRSDVTVVYNGIDTARFTGDGVRAELDRLSNLPPTTEPIVRIGLVATYARWKGQKLFLDAAARVARGARGLRARYYVVGGPTYETRASQFTACELREEIDARGLGEVAGLVPFQREPDRVFRALDVVVHASTSPEPFGRSIAEAMSCGCAVVVAREGGASEIIDEGVDALAVVPRDPAALASAIATLASDPALRVRLGVAARAKASTRFARDRLGPQILSEYRRIGAMP